MKLMSQTRGSTQRLRTSLSRSKGVRYGLILSICSMVTLTMLACSVPVFRYALERWQADPYRITVFHRGALNAEQKKMIDQLDPQVSSAAKHMNAIVRVVDLETETDQDTVDLWKEHGGELPNVVVQYPFAARVEKPVLKAPLAEHVSTSIVSSPARKTMAKSIVDGDTAVWLFLESGEESADEKALKILKEQLKVMETTIELPEQDPSDYVSAGREVPDLRVSFPVISLKRDSAEESFLVDMLLDSESDLRELKGPMAFPVFGRGRILYALIGAGINPDTVAEACVFLTGACSCEVKDQNPGIDMLVTYDWESHIESTIVNKPLPPLTGLEEFASSDESGSSADSETESGAEDASASQVAVNEEGPGQVSSTQELGSTTTSTPVAGTTFTASATAVTPTMAFSRWILMIAIGGGVLFVLVAVATVVLMVRKA